MLQGESTTAKPGMWIYSIAAVRRGQQLRCVAAGLAFQELCQTLRIDFLSAVHQLVFRVLCCGHTLALPLWLHATIPPCWWCSVEKAIADIDKTVWLYWLIRLFSFWKISCMTHCIAGMAIVSRNLCKCLRRPSGASLCPAISDMSATSELALDSRQDDAGNS